MTDLLMEKGVDVAKETASPFVSAFIKKAWAWTNYAIIPKYQHFAKYKTMVQGRFETVNNPVFANAQKKLDEVFVPQTIIIEESGEEKVLDGYPRELLSKYRRLIIKDTAGRGKSTLMKKLFLWSVDAKEYPIFIDLRNLGKDHCLWDEILKEVGEINHKFDSYYLERLITDGGLLFLLDGYDEVNPDDISEVAKDLLNFVSRAEGNMFVLTSREDDRLAGFSGFKGVRLKDFTIEQAYDLIRKYDGNSGKAEEIIHNIENGEHNEVREFLRSPLHTTLFYGAYHQGRAVPFKLHEVCRDIYNALFDDHDMTKNPEFVHRRKCHLSASDYERVLGCIGRYCLAKDTYEVGETDMAIVLKGVRAQCPDIEFADESILYDISICLSVFKKKRTSYEWIHETMCHYFTARSISLENPTKIANVLAHIYASAHLERYVKMLRIYNELNPMEFRKHFLLEFLKDYQKYYVQCIGKNHGTIGSDSWQQRSFLLFKNRIRLLFRNAELQVVLTPQRLTPLLPLLKEGHDHMFASMGNGEKPDGNLYLTEGDSMELCINTFSGSQQQYDLCNMIVAFYTGTDAYLLFQQVIESIQEYEKEKSTYEDGILINLQDGI